MSDEVPTTIEEWRPVVGYEERYKVSNLGRVSSFTPHSIKNGLGKILKAHAGRYARVLLYTNNQKRALCLVHRLVLQAFNPCNDLTRTQTNHKNGHKRDNAFSNLEWCNASENKKHCYRVLGQAPAKGELNGMAKLSNLQITEIFKARAQGLTQAAIASNYGVLPWTIGRILKRARWGHIKI